MGWDVVEDGLKVVFSRDIPSLVRAEVMPATEEFLAAHGLTLVDIDGFICHPGGARVLDALEAVFELPRGGLTDAREVLRDHGNMSAPTVLFVLEAAIRAGKRGRQLMIALGPGFTVAFQIIELG
jgi:alkylresorcinol/alkylpyrone synthase